MATTDRTRLSSMLPSIPFVLASLAGRKSIPKYALLTSHLNVDMGSLDILYPSHQAAPDFVLTMAAAMRYAGDKVSASTRTLTTLNHSSSNQPFQTSSLKHQTKTPSTSNASNFSCRVLQSSHAQSNARRPNASTISSPDSLPTVLAATSKNTAASPYGYAYITRSKQTTPSMSTT
jgi:hypothetical protein